MLPKTHYQNFYKHHLDARLYGSDHLPGLSLLLS
jgi:hypothetical protein